jgi:phosphohistidine phosphatase
MKAFLVRHSHALPNSDDSRRRLSAQGKQVTRDVAGFLKSRNVLGSVHAVWYSPLARARETAELLIEELGLDVLLIEVPGLLPEDDPADLADRLDGMDVPVMIIGHEPQLGALATILVRGKTNPLVFEFKKTAVLALERTSRRHKKSGRSCWQVRWYLSPELLVSRDTQNPPRRG